MGETSTTDVPDRIPCLVPFCRCTAPAAGRTTGWEIICAKHWRAVPRALKACYRRARSARRTIAAADEAARQRFLGCPEAAVYRPGADMHPIEAERWRAVHRLVAADARCARLWRICRREAIEAAGGIG